MLPFFTSIFHDMFDSSEEEEKLKLTARAQNTIKIGTMIVKTKLQLEYLKRSLPEKRMNICCCEESPTIKVKTTK